VLPHRGQNLDVGWVKLFLCLSNSFEVIWKLNVVALQNESALTIGVSAAALFYSFLPVIQAI